jgi:hypothetical protein
MDNIYTIKEPRDFLSRLKVTLKVKVAALVYDKDGFYLFLINEEGKGKEVHFGELDMKKCMSGELFDEIKELVDAQGW